MALSVIFNHAQLRAGRDRLPLIAKGAEMDRSLLVSGCWVEPVNNRILLQPYCLTPTWQTSNSGNYAKLALSSWTTSGTWEERSHEGSIKGPWLAVTDTASSGSILTSTTYSKNRGFWLAAHVYGQTNRAEILRCGWNSSASISAGVGLIVYTDGTVEVYKDGAIVGDGRIPVQKNGLLDLTLIPHAHRELLVYSQDGDGRDGRGSAFSVLFDDIAEDAADPTIVPAQKFWISGSGGLQVMAAPILFPSSGYIHSVKQSFMDAPASGASLETWTNDSWVGGGPFNYRAYGHPAYVSSQSVTIAATDWAGTAFSANGSNIEARLKFTLSTSSTGYTPTIYGGQLAYQGTFATTDDSEEADVTDYVTRAELSVPDDSHGVTWTLEFREPEAVEALVPNFRKGTNIPVKIMLGSIILTDGRTGTPELHTRATDEASRLTVEVYDGFKGAESARFAEPIPIEDLAPEQILTFLAQFLGIEDTNVTISTSGYTLGMGTSGEVDSWEPLIAVGDTPGLWLRNIIEDYAATWIHGIRPTAGGTVPEYFALDPADLGTAAILTLYDKDTDSASLGSHTGLDIPRYVYCEAQDDILEPEATEIRVTGRHPITDRLIQAYKVDTAAEDATTAPSSRPSNWVGEKRRYGLENNAIMTQAVANEACSLLYDRLTPIRELCEWKGWQLKSPINDRPLWRGDNVRLYGRGIYRIISFGGGYTCQDGTVNNQDFTYVAEKVAEEPGP